MSLALAVALAALGQFSQIDTNGDGTPNIYRWLGATAEWRVGGAGSGFAGAAGQCLMSAGPAATPAWGACGGGGGITGTGTDHHITRWDGTTDVQDSGLVLDDSGYIGRVAASGSDQPGTDIRLAAGAGTGAGLPGTFWVSTPSILGSGMTVQTVMDRMIVGGSTTASFILLGNPDIDNIVTTPVDSFIYATSGSAGRGGDFTWQAGHHYGAAGRGGDVLIHAGSTGDSGIERGGNVDITPGGTEGDGASGSIRLFGVDGSGTATEMVVVQSDELTISSGIITLDNTLAEISVSTGLVMSLVGDYGTAGDVLTSNGAGSGMTWETPSGAPGGSTTEIQYNNAGAFGGIAGATTDGTTLEIEEVSAPAAPTTGVKLFATDLSHSIPSYRMPAFSAVYTLPPLASNWHVAGIVPGTGTAPVSLGIPSNTTGTASHPAIADSTTLTRQRRIQYASAAGAGSSAGTRSGLDLINRGTAAGRGGFIFMAQFASSTAVAQQRQFIGIKDTTAVIGNVNPSTVVDSFYFGYDSAQTTWRVCGNDNAGAATCVDCGANFPVNTTALYEGWFSSDPDGTSIDYRLRRLDSSVTDCSGNVSAAGDLPRDSALYNTEAWINNGTTASAAQLQLLRMWVASPQEL